MSAISRYNLNFMDKQQLQCKVEKLANHIKENKELEHRTKICSLMMLEKQMKKLRLL